jgi:uncharacterized Zn-finger protein
MMAKRFYLCPKCNTAFCLKGGKWCREQEEAERTHPHNSGIQCKGKNNANPHEPVYMTFVGTVHSDLVDARIAAKPQI